MDDDNLLASAAALLFLFALGAADVFIRWLVKRIKERGGGQNKLERSFKISRL